MSDKEQKNEAPKFQMGPGGGGGPGANLHRAPVKLKNAKGTLRRLVAYLAGQNKIIAFVFIFSLISTIIGIVGTRVNGLVIDKYINSQFKTGMVV